MTKSLNHRKDNRSIDQFKADIKAATQREQILMQLVSKHINLYHQDFKYESFGIDNSGEFTETSDCRPDFKVWYANREELWEVKVNQYSHKQTFKVHDLQEYIRYNAHILLVYGIGHDKTKIDHETTRWAIISPKNIAQMLADKPHQRGDSKWGGKQVVVIYPKEYHLYFKEEKLHE